MKEVVVFLNKIDGLENEPDLLDMAEEEIRALLDVCFSVSFSLLIFVIFFFRFFFFDLSLCCVVARLNTVLRIQIRLSSGSR